jgi:hypothetical protein
MVTMMDEIFDRNYQSGRAGLNRDLDRAFAKVGRALGDSLKVLHRIEWSAPWQADRKKAQCN